MERSGAAQGLAEVLAVLGHEYIEGLLPDILISCKSKNSNVREGHLTLFKFLPAALGDSFQVNIADYSLILFVHLVHRNLMFFLDSGGSRVLSTIRKTVSPRAGS